MRVHHGTADVLARVVRAGERYAQLRLAEPVVAARGDRVVLRAGTTVGGGVVLDPAPPRHASTERMELVERGEIAATVHEPVREEMLRHLVDGPLEGVERAGGWIFSRAWLDGLRAEPRAADRRGRPARPGRAAAARAVGGRGRAAARARAARREALPAGRGRRARRARATPPPPSRRSSGSSRCASRTGRSPASSRSRARLVRVGDGLAVAPAAYERARAALVAECEVAGRITLARFRDLLGVGRKTAQLLLERFDADGLTRRVGDERVLRRRSP